MLHGEIYESHMFKRSRSSSSAALVLISAPNQYQGTMALSTGVAHPWDMDCRQVAFSFATPRGPEGLTVAENGRGIRTASRDGCGKKSMKVTRSLVSVVDDDESVRESLPDLLKEFGFAARAFSSAQEFLAS